MSFFLISRQVPNTINISKSENEKFGQQQAYLSTSWLEKDRSDLYNPSGYVDSACWKFDGNFTKKMVRVSVNRLPSIEKPFKIRDLGLYPIIFAEEGLENALRTRGEMFWKCRQRNYVCYGGEWNDGIQSTVRKTSTCSSKVLD